MSLTPRELGVAVRRLFRDLEEEIEFKDELLTEALAARDASDEAFLRLVYAASGGAEKAEAAMLLTDKMRAA